MCGPGSAQRGERREPKTQQRRRGQRSVVQLEEYDWGKYTAGNVVVGESFYTEDLSRIMAAVRYADPGHRQVSACTMARLVREVDNPHDPNAVAVVVGEPPVVVGHINRTDAAAVASTIESPMSIRAKLTKHRDGKFSVAIDRAAWQGLRPPEPDAHNLAKRTVIKSTTKYTDRADLSALAPKVPKAFCWAYESATSEGEEWERSKKLKGRLVATGHRLKRQALAVECRDRIAAHVSTSMQLDPDASDGTDVEVEIIAYGECQYLADGPHTPGGWSQDDDGFEELEDYCTRDFEVVVRVHP